MVERLDHDNRTIRDLNLNLEGRVRERTKQLEKLVAELSRNAEAAHRLQPPARRGPRRGRSRQPRQERVPGQYLARAAHAAQRRDRHDRPVAGRRRSTRSSANTCKRRNSRARPCSTCSTRCSISRRSRRAVLEVEQIPFDLHEMIEPVIELMATPLPRKVARDGLLCRPQAALAADRRPGPAAADRHQPGE